MVKDHMGAVQRGEALKNRQTCLFCTRVGQYLQEDVHGEERLKKYTNR